MPTQAYYKKRNQQRPWSNTHLSGFGKTRGLLPALNGDCSVPPKGRNADTGWHHKVLYSTSSLWTPALTLQCQDSPLLQSVCLFSSVSLFVKSIFFFGCFNKDQYFYNLHGRSRGITGLLGSKCKSKVFSYLNFLNPLSAARQLWDLEGKIKQYILMIFLGGIRRILSCPIQSTCHSQRAIPMNSLVTDGSKWGLRG